MEYFCCFHDYRRKVARLSDQEVGRLFRALMEYSETGQAQELTGRECIAFDFIAADIDRAKRAYGEKCQKNRENRNGRGRSSTAGAQEEEKEKEEDKKEEKEEDSPPKAPRGGRSSSYSSKKGKGQRASSHDIEELEAMSHFWLPEDLFPGYTSQR